MTRGDRQWPTHCRAFVVDKGESGTAGNIRQHALPAGGGGEVLVRIAYSALNYKDALVLRGARGIASSYPHVPGIDAAGVVEASSGSPDWVGQQVLVTGFGLGVERAGGWSEYLVVPEDWLVRIPSSLSMLDSMILGTAGLTAALSIEALFEGRVRSGDPVLVTGATGGVGSHAVAILASLGLRVTASSRKPEAASYLRDLGAHEVSHPDALAVPGGKALAHPRWQGAVDTVGGEALADILKQTADEGVVALCGMAGGTHFHSSVFPFILRGVRLTGIDSVHVSLARRVALWEKLAGPWKPRRLAAMSTIIPLSDVAKAAERVLSGTQTGRVVVRVGADPERPGTP